MGLWTLKLNKINVGHGFLFLITLMCFDYCKDEIFMCSGRLMGWFWAGNWMDPRLIMLKWMVSCCICKMSRKKRSLKRNPVCISTQVKMWTCEQFVQLFYLVCLLICLSVWIFCGCLRNELGDMKYTNFAFYLVDKCIQLLVLQKFGALNLYYE